MKSWGICTRQNEKSPLSSTEGAMAMCQMRHVKVEAAGIEPASCESLAEASTCVVCRLSLVLDGTANKAAVGPGHDMSRLGRSDR